MLLNYISPVALEVIEWKALLKESRPLLSRLAQRKGVDDLQNYLKPMLLPRVLFHEESNFESFQNYFEDIRADEKKWIGDQMLWLYFRQLKSTQGIFLDLRLNHFSLDDTGESLTWQPSGLWYHFTDDFRMGAIELYEGFYLQDAKKFGHALTALGLVSKNFTDGDKQHLEKLLYNHFGQGLNEEIEFSMEAFSQSFHELFLFLLEKRVRLTPDFLFLGIYLVTLYLSLSHLQQKHSPLRAFHEAQ